MVFIAVKRYKYHYNNINAYTPQRCDKKIKSRFVMKRDKLYYICGIK